MPLDSSARRGGGWARPVPDDTGRSFGVLSGSIARSRRSSPAVENFREKLLHVMERKADLDFCENPYRRTALWEATWRNHESIVRLLAKNGASVSKADVQGRTPLHEAAFYGHLRLARFLLDSGHPADCNDSSGQTPLFRAVEGGHEDVVRLLLERKAEPNLLDRDRVSPFHLAEFSGRPALAQLLLVSGAHKNRFSLEESGRTPAAVLDLALPRAPETPTVSKTCRTMQRHVRSSPNLRAGASLVLAGS